MILRRVILAGLAALMLAGSAAADAPQLLPKDSLILAEGRDRGRARPLNITLALNGRAPFRVYLLDGPPRLIVEVKGLDLPADANIPGDTLLAGLRWGPGAPGWSRIVAQTGAPMRIASAGYQDARLAIRLEPVAAQDFTPRGDSVTVLRGLPEPVEMSPPPTLGPLKVMLDPGHGGIDPGAQIDGLSEAALMLEFARQVQAALTAKGIAVELTRDADQFVPLERRTTLARAAGAGLFLSLHADALPQGEAAGATIYIWDPDSNDRGARELAMRHDRADLLAGADLGDSDEAITHTLIDLARTESQPRGLRFAKHLSSELNLAGVGLAGRPVRGAGFSVLKSPDIPSVLLEVGFLSDANDRARLSDPAWRQRAAEAIARAIADWAADDAAAQAVRMK